MMMSHLIDLAKQHQNFRAYFIPTIGSEEELVEAALVASAHDHTPDGVRLRRAATSRLVQIYREEGRDPESLSVIRQRVQEKHALVKEGPLEAIEIFTRSFGGSIHNQLRRLVSQVKVRGGIAIVVADEKYDLGVVCFEAA